MKPQLYTVHDPVSGFPFTIVSPINLTHKETFVLHPCYTLPLDKLYKETKNILLNNEASFPIQAKRLALGALLVTLAKTGQLEFKQFSTLELSYNFFNDHELISKFFFLIPKIVHGTPRMLKRLPKFRVTQNQLGSIGPWIDRCIAIINETKANEHFYDEQRESQKELLKVKPAYDKWRLYSKNKHCLPQKVIHYIHTVCMFTPQDKVAFHDFLTQSAGTLYLRHKIRSTESVDLFWTLLECIDKIECAPMQDSITLSVTKWLKVKVDEWVNWHPQFLSLSLDYRLLATKEQALKELPQWWAEYEQTLTEERIEMKALANQVKDRLEELKKKRQASKAFPAVNSFTIIEPSDKGHAP